MSGFPTGSDSPRPSGSPERSSPPDRTAKVGRWVLFALLLTAVLAAATASLRAQEARPLAPDAFMDPAAERLFRAAQTNWQSIDSSVVRYTALIKQRIAAGIRTPLKDRTIYRNESAARAFWDRDHDALIQVLGARAEFPGQDRRNDALAWLDDLTIDDPFEPGGDRLLFGITNQNDPDISDPDSSDFWFAHPLARGADTLYRYRSGDTLTLSLPDGRRLLTVQLDVIPREADPHRIAGALCIEPESGDLVRAVYQLSRGLDVIRDIPEVRAEDEAGEFRMVPGILKPWIFSMTLVAIDYSYWEFKVWLPRSMRVEGEVRIGVLKMPISFDLSYGIESVTMEDDLDEPPDPNLRERHFKSRAEAMAFLSQLLTDENGVRYEPLADVTRRAGSRTSRFLVPEDPSLLRTSPDLPPPIWEDAPGFASEEDLQETILTLADLPPIPTQGIPWQLNWGWARQDLLRYNRVEGPAVGGHFQAELGSFMGPIDFRASGFFGFADLEPKGRLELERATVKRRVTLGGFRELRFTEPRGRYLELGNSLNAFLFGRDDGDYYLATWADLVWRPPDTSRQSYRLRLYGERQDPVSNKADFALFRAFDGAGTFRPNIQADLLEEVGGELTLSPWWGSDPLAAQVGLELYAQGAAWRPPGTTGSESYGRARGTLRVAVPLVEGNWRVGLEAGGGTSWGEVPLQRNWFLGGPLTLRGYDVAAISGTTFGRGRIEVARVFSQVGSLSAFGDVGWAGPREMLDRARPLWGVGVGGSLLDGLIRMDISHGFRGPGKSLRFDLYLDAIL